MTNWWYRIRGYAVRRDACKLAAMTMRGTGAIGLLWQAAKFYEVYLLFGADEAERNFGPQSKSQQPPPYTSAQQAYDEANSYQERPLRRA